MNHNFTQSDAFVVLATSFSFSWQLLSGFVGRIMSSPALLSYFE